MNYSPLKTPASLWMCRDAPAEQKLAVDEFVSIAAISELVAVVCSLSAAKAEAFVEALCGQSSLLDPYTLWARLRVASVPELQAIGNLTPKQAAKLKASLELGRRVYTVNPDLPTYIQSPQDMAQLLSQHLAFKDVECFVAIALDIKHRVLALRQFTQGSATETTVPPRELFRWALAVGATRLAIGHNHPSGDAIPSIQDNELTQQLVKAAQYLGLHLLDHIVVGNDSFTSIRQQSPYYWSEELVLPF